MNQPLALTFHAEYRCLTRNLTEDELRYAIRYGDQHHNAGALTYFLGKRHIPSKDRKDQRIAQLEGLHVVTVREGEVIVVITAYRNRDGYKEFRSRSKYDLSPRTSRKLSLLARAEEHV
ncbi:MAG: DUF4258 domain-containing protein [Anaerolineae bacterium]|nr:DUF4258 domain-containing protein [Anaerolineae bacterium]